ncbi:oxygen-independent coproporphyrinogen III oxidase [Microvirga pudoricolor]|uniref:oxygen-independent coproporphyrinogen III oxidase n=1 Tax=Microvirga pudoricolor TaxID=2778729 RepID=UPI00194F8490|nr:oxygen-independent coproporphyrinogen III oxidase [Microvirga pudoricolor]MBM6595214.1 oxygen-independent coproporphyrinogen III oxidase [Microvirga pudoricolor]
MNEGLIRRYAGLSVPRYTSYPTAAEFSPAVGASAHEKWLKQADPREPVSIYLHVPYCRELCHYCGCHAKALRRADVLADYRQALEAEIRLAGSLLSSPLRVARLHWGGGTPSLLGGEGLASVIDVLQRYVMFQDGMEHAIELDPRHVDAGLARDLARIGINRASLGVQDLDPAVQRAIGRVQPFAQVEHAMALLRERELADLNVDLIHGLPFQTQDSIRRTCAQVADLKPSRVACYGYAHMPERKRHQRLIDTSALPGPRERFLQAQAVAEAFRARGYVAVGIDHFAQPGDPVAQAAQDGTLHRNFQGYTDDDRPVLIGFGASSISRFHEGFAQNATDIGAYKEAVGRGQLASARGYRFSDQDEMRGAIIESLMCRWSVDLGEWDTPDRFADERALLRPFILDGLVRLQGTRVVMTDEGRPFVRLVAAVFDEFRHDGRDARFSKAV